MQEVKAENTFPLTLVRIPGALPPEKILLSILPQNILLLAQHVPFLLGIPLGLQLISKIRTRGKGDDYATCLYIDQEPDERCGLQFSQIPSLNLSL